MDSLAGKYKSDIKRPGPFSGVMRTAQGITRWLIGFFTFTKEERLKAGIYLKGEGRER